MVEKRLLDYVKRTVSAGYSVKRVRDALLKKGWRPEDVDEAIKSAQNTSSKKIPQKSPKGALPGSPQSKQPETGTTQKQAVKQASYPGQFTEQSTKSVQGETQAKQLKSTKSVKGQTQPLPQTKSLKSLTGQVQPKQQKQTSSVSESQQESVVKAVPPKKSTQESQQPSQSTKKTTQKKTEEIEEDPFKDFDFGEGETTAKKQSSKKSTESVKAVSDKKQTEQVQAKQSSKKSTESVKAVSDKKQTEQVQAKPSQQQKQPARKSSGKEVSSYGTEKKDNLKGLKITLIILIVLFVLVLGFGVWYFFFFNGGDLFGFLS